MQFHAVAKYFYKLPIPKILFPVVQLMLFLRYVCEMWAARIIYT